MQIHLQIFGQISSAIFLVSVVTSTRSPSRGARADLSHQIVDLPPDRADLHLRVDKSRRADDLLDKPVRNALSHNRRASR